MSLKKGFKTSDEEGIYGAYMSGEYISLGIENIVPTAISPVAFYVQTAGTIYTKVYDAGEKPKNVQLLQQNGQPIKTVWIKKSDFKKLIKYQISIATQGLSNKLYRIDDKTSLVAQATATLFQEISINGIDPQNYFLIQELSKCIGEYVLLHSDLYVLVDELNIKISDFVKYSLTVCTLSMVLGQAMGWRNPQTFEKLLIGGLLHRIGLLEFPKDLQICAYSELPIEYQDAYKNYPHKGMNMLQGVGFAHEDILTIVFQHQERANSQGFPQGLRDGKINPLARVVSVADAFAEHIIPHAKNNYTSISLDKAYAIMSDSKSRFNKEVFDAANKVLGRNSLNKIY